MSNIRRGVHCTSAKRKLKTEKGITLVALVLTIIVLLILAGISLNLILGDGGILNRTTNARKTSDLAGAQEKVELLVAEASYDYLQARYVNGNGSLAEGKDEYILNLLSQKVGSFEGCTLALTDHVLTLSKDGKSVTGTIGTDGTLTWADSTSGGSTNTVANTSTNTTSNTTSNTVENTTGGGTGTVTSLKFADANGNEQADVGEAVEYNIPYTDVYNTSTTYTKDNGWLLLSATEETAGSGIYTVKLMSAGIPAKLYYHYSTNAPGDWWGTAEQAGSSNSNSRAAYGLEHKFESITFEQNITPVANGNGSYTSIGTSTGNVTGAIFKAGSNVSVHNMTYTEANSLGSNDARKVGTGSSYYWLASPNTNYPDHLYFVRSDGYINSGGNGTYGVRPVVSISGVTLSAKSQ